jgi:molecular chaperone GrpE
VNLKEVTPLNTEQKQTAGDQTAEETIADNETEATYEAEPSAVSEEQSEPAADLQAELDRARRLFAESQDKLVRVQADFDNFRRRTRQEKEEFAKYASLKVIEQLLPVVDNFERALASSKDGGDFESLRKGLEMTFRQLEQALSSEGLQAMEAVGQPFNPEFHQAVMKVETSEFEEGIVVEELQKGYLLKDKVIRPAMVKVSG